MILVGIDYDDNSVYQVTVKWRNLWKALEENNRIQKGDNRSKWYRKIVNMDPQEIDALVIGDLHNSSVKDYEIKLLGELQEVE